MILRFLYIYNERANGVFFFACKLLKIKHLKKSFIFFENFLLKSFVFKKIALPLHCR